MGQAVTVFPAQPSFRQTLTLGDAQFELRLQWRERLAAWYADLWTAAGLPVWLGVRVSPGWALGFGLVAENAPDGVLFVRGPPEYSRMDLGGSVQIVFYATEELESAGDDDTSGLAITTP